MGVSAKVPTITGEEASLYIRLNNLDQVANHDVPAVARFRGYASREAYEDGKPFLFETTVEFDADVSKALWSQAYRALLKREDMSGAERVQ